VEETKCVGVQRKQNGKRNTTTHPGVQRKQNGIRHTTTQQDVQNKQNDIRNTETHLYVVRKSIRASRRRRQDLAGVQNVL
jgi:hypothetical protein